MNKMTDNRMDVSLAMVKCLEKEGIKVVFGYPGAAICPFYDALYSADIRHILVRHEQNAGHAANGYARMTGKPAVCIATSGPGATNLITAIATAYMDSIPMVVITGQVRSELIGRDVFQEADITGASEPFVKHSYLVKDANEIPEIFKRAFYIAGTGRPGPVLIDIPIDIQQTEIEFDYPESVDIRSYKPSSKGHPLQIKRVVEAIIEAERPVICAGGGVFASNASELIGKLSETAEIPIVTTMMGIGAVPSEHPLNFGMVGMHGSRAANIAINRSDLMIIIGARVGDRAVATPGVLEKRTRIIHIDIDPAEIGKNLDVAIPLVGDANIILSQMLEKIPKMEHDDWIATLNEKRKEIDMSKAEEGYINPNAFIRMLSDSLDDNVVCVADVGQNQIWAATSFNIKKGRFLTSGGMGTMGYSVPCAIGAKAASPDTEVVAICGDGAFQMQMMELATACQHDIPIKIVVMSNNRLGMVREVQTRQYDDRLCSIFLDGSPDFIKLADSYGIKARRVDNIDNAQEAIDELISSKGPYLLECIVSPTHPTL